MYVRTPSAFALVSAFRSEATRRGRLAGAAPALGRVAAAFLLCLLAVSPASAQAGRFTTGLALDVRSAQIADMTEDGRRLAVVVRTRRGRTEVDHQRFGDPTYVAPSLVTAMVVDTRSGARTW